MPNVLELSGVDVRVSHETVCKDVHLTITGGQTHVLLGPNGCGKSSLLSAIMGLSPYEVSGSISLNGEEIGSAQADVRARGGLAMAFQRPPALRGITMRGLAAALDASETLLSYADSLDLAPLLDRDVNTGFSGGEIKRWEILKVALQRPLMCLFDEPESGVDLEHIAAVGAAIERLLSESTDNGMQRGALVITHTGFILDYLRADVGHLMLDGQIVYSGDPYALFSHIQKNGYTVPGEALVGG